MNNFKLFIISKKLGHLSLLNIKLMSYLIISLEPVMTNYFFFLALISLHLAFNLITFNKYINVLKQLILF